MPFTNLSGFFFGFFILFYNQKRLTSKGKEGNHNVNDKDNYLVITLNLTIFLLNTLSYKTFVLL